MTAPKSPLDIVWTLADQLFPRRTPGEVQGFVNGVMTVAVDGKIRNVEYSGVEDIKAGHRIWLRRIPDDPQDNYSYEGLRLENGSIAPPSEPAQAQADVSEKSAQKYGSNVRVRDGDTDTTFPARKYIEFQGVAVTVTDDPDNDKVIVSIFASAPPDADWDDPTVDWDDPDIAWGG